MNSLGTVFNVPEQFKNKILQGHINFCFLLINVCACIAYPNNCE